MSFPTPAEAGEVKRERRMKTKNNNTQMKRNEFAWDSFPMGHLYHMSLGEFFSIVFSAEVKVINNI